MKVKYFLATVLMGIMVMAFGNASVMADEIVTTGEEETTFDYSKMDKNFQYRETWESYYDISFCSNVKTSKASYSYTGKEVKPVINVQVHDTKSSKVNKTLDKKYYTVEWKNNINPGTATAIVKGINGFYGEKKITFKIKIPNVKIKSVTSKGRKITVKVIKNNIKGINYEIRYKRNTGKLISIKNGYKTKGKWKYKNSKKTKIKMSKLKKGNYFVQVRSYVVVDNKKCSSKWKVCDYLVNIKTNKANKKNFKFGKYRSPNKFSKLKKKHKGYMYFRWFYTKSSKVNGISECNWYISDSNNKSIYAVFADKRGTVIYKH